MKRLLNIWMLFILVIPTCFGQTAGFYGKHHFVEVNGLSNLRLFGLFLDGKEIGRSYAKVKNGELVKGRDLIDAGFSISIGKAYSNNLGAGLETGFYFQSIPGSFNYEFEGSLSPASSLISHEMLRIRTFGVMPKLIITRSGGLIPIGLTHELGVGINNSKVVKKDYEIQISNPSGLTSTELELINDRFVDYDKSYGGVTFMYAMNMRTPINRSILINYGLRYTLNIWNYLRDYQDSDSFLSNEQVAQSIGRMRFSNFITLNAGITYSF